MWRTTSSRDEWEERKLTILRSFFEDISYSDKDTDDEDAEVMRSCGPVSPALLFKYSQRREFAISKSLVESPESLSVKTNVNSHKISSLGSSDGNESIDENISSSINSGNQITDSGTQSFAPIPEGKSSESEKDTSNSSINFDSSSSASSNLRAISPLPDLIVEKEPPKPNLHDEPEDFYKQLEVTVNNFIAKLKKRSSADHTDSETDLSSSYSNNNDDIRKSLLDDSTDESDVIKATYDYHENDDDSKKSLNADKFAFSAACSFEPDDSDNIDDKLTMKNQITEDNSDQNGVYISVNKYGKNVATRNYNIHSVYNSGSKSTEFSTESTCKIVIQKVAADIHKSDILENEEVISNSGEVMQFQGNIEKGLLLSHNTWKNIDNDRCDDQFEEADKNRDSADDEVVEVMRACNPASQRLSLEYRQSRECDVRGTLAESPKSQSTNRKTMSLGFNRDESIDKLISSSMNNGNQITGDGPRSSTPISAGNLEMVEDTLNFGGSVPSPTKRPRTTSFRSPDVAIDASVKWDDIKSNLFIGTPTIYRLCKCRHHVCNS